MGLLTQTQSLDDSTIAIDIACLPVVQQCATLSDEAGKCAFRAVVLAVLLHVLGEVSNAEAEECNLALGTTGVGRALSELLEEFGFLSGI